FPLFIPKSFLENEAAHIEGFAKECAVVTHTRLEAGPNGELIPASPLEEPLIVRPTSETIIGEVYSQWVQSYRDLPILINQWCNVVRWEMRTRLFLRTTEFLWQEGHTAHATAEEAMEETLKMLNVYTDFAQNYMAMPVIRGEKSPAERFPGAVNTYCIESMMQDCKALQAGTSHFLGQNFSKASNIQFLDETGVRQHAWTTSWGSSTRLIGGLIMTHSDDDGLVLPPRIAPSHVVILPIAHEADKRAEVMEYCERLRQELKGVQFDGRPLEVEMDTRDLRGGEKMWQWIKRGIPMWIEVGPRDMASDSLFVGRRDLGAGGRYGQKRAEFVATVSNTLNEIQQGLLDKALAFRKENTRQFDSMDDLYAYFTPKNEDKPEIHGGFAEVHWSGDPQMEAQLKNDLKVTLRCIPLDGEKVPGKCLLTG
ncbi:MAG TPA: His/Gly/Thr/Pro-type tRNA ligase C-terminal domain-containing protein, partial [Opitutales bacterium]|nr:His/Gly/Thr/Pro-type tRNA ligase C-terminal domain-containing protein [Opitutales bacterium]